jgi:hypothetical protein
LRNLSHISPFSPLHLNHHHHHTNTNKTKQQNKAPIQRANILTKGAVIHVIDELLVPPPVAQRTRKAKPVTAAEAEDKTRLGAADLASVAPKSTPAASSASAAAFTAAAVVAAPLALVLAL